MQESSRLTDEQLASVYTWPATRTFRLNMLLGRKGEVSGEDGTSVSLTSSEDRRILRTIRKDADVIISGGQSIRSEGWFLPPLGRMIVLSQSKNVPLESCPDPSRVFIASDISAALHHLRRTDFKILCEGGLSTARLVHEHALFDEIALTTIGETLVLPDFLDITQYSLDSELSDTAHDMTFRFWRRAVYGG